MKLLKRVLTGTLALTLALGLSVPAAAAEKSSGAEKTVTSAGSKREVIGTVTGFGALEVKEISMAERLPIGQVLSRLPETLGVYLDGSDKLSQIPVSWYCPGGYEDSNDFYFQFSPTWDEDSYPLAEGLSVERDAPYVAVYLADLNALGSLPGPGPEDGAARRAVAPGSADEIFAVLTGELGLNSAAACGILANMHAESALNPRSSCKDTNGKTSYGLCQWNGGRFTNLKSWCSANGEDYTTVTGQLRFLAYELPAAYPKVYDYIMSVDDDADGAYDAAYYWCYYYEMPASRGKRSVERGNLAQDTYWPVYGGTAMAMEELPEPVLTGVTTPEITMQPGQSLHVAGTIQCSNGLEEVAVWVWDSKGKQTTGATVKPGSRIFSLSTVDSDVKFSKLKSGRYTYRITAKVGGTEYSLLEHPFTVAGETEETTTVEESKPTQAAAVEQPAETGEQSDENAPSLTDASRPGEEHPQGRAVTVRGTVSADFKLEKVTARVLRENGSEATGGSAKVSGKRYDLYKLDNKVGFSKLSSGRYTYEITAQADGNTWTLLDYPFTVTPKAPGGVKLSRGKKALTVKWSSVKGADGYEIQYARGSSASGGTVVTVQGKTSRKLSGLSKKKKYAVRVRSFVVRENGERSYSAFSGTKKAKTK